MATVTKDKLSESTNGRQIKVAATGTPGTTIHTACSGTANWDEIWLYATNNDTADIVLTIEYGGTTSPDDLNVVTIPARSGLVHICPGLILQNSLLVKAFAGISNKVMISGYVNKIVA